MIESRVLSMTTLSRSSVHLDVEPGEHRASYAIEPDAPFRILIVGDFSGRANRGIRAKTAAPQGVAQNHNIRTGLIG